MAILTVPILLDFWITSDTLNTPWGWASVIVMPYILSLPGDVSICVSGLTKPFSIAKAMTKGFMVEPGSKVSVSARLRICIALKLLRFSGA